LGIVLYAYLLTHWAIIVYLFYFLFEKFVFVIDALFNYVKLLTFQLHRDKLFSVRFKNQKGKVKTVITHI